MKSLFKKILSSAFIMVFLCIAFTVSYDNSWAADETIELKFASQFPSNHYLSKLDKKWMEKITKETNGRVKFQFFSGGSLLDPRKAWYELSQGAADIANLSNAMATGFDLSNAMGTFHYGTDIVTLHKLLPKVIQKFPAIQDEFKANKVLLMAGQVPRYIASSKKKPIRTVDDFKGLQWKPPAGLPGMIEKLGGVPVRIPFVETYNALDKGTIDAAIIPAQFLDGFRVAEVTKYHTNLHLPSYGIGALRAMNWDSWNKLPKDIQKIIEDSLPWYGNEILYGKLEISDKSLAFAKKLGDEIIEMAPEEYEKLYGLLDELGKETAAKIDAKGKPGTEVYKYMRQLIKEATEGKTD